MSRALALMARGQAGAAETLRAHGARAMTDVTGFGLVGHVERLLEGSALRAAIDVRTVPALPGAPELARAGVRSSAWPNNRRALDRFDGAGTIDEAVASLLADPQTAGALLAVVPAGCVAGALEALNRPDAPGRTGGDADAPGAAIVGTLEVGAAHRLIAGEQASLIDPTRRAA